MAVKAVLCEHILTPFDDKATANTPFSILVVFFKRMLPRLVGFGCREKICSSCKTLK